MKVVCGSTVRGGGEEQFAGGSGGTAEGGVGVGEGAV